MVARPSLKKLYEVAGRRLLIDAEDEWSDLAVARLFSGWYLTPLADFESHADATIKISCGSFMPAVPKGLDAFDISHGGTCYTDGETLYLNIDESLVIVRPGLMSPTVRVWIKQGYDFWSEILAQLISQAFSSALRRCGLFELHSGGVLPPNKERAFLIVGESGSGKSTLTLQLATCGWRYLSDDILLLDDTSQGIEAHSLRRFFALTADTIDAVQLPNLQSTANARIKERLAPEDLFPAGRAISARPGTILFSAITDESGSRVRRLSQYETMARLLRQCPWATYDKSTAGPHLKTLSGLTGQTIGYDLFAGRDLLGNPARTEDLFAGCLREL